MSITLVVAPISEPISVSDVREHCRIVSNDDNVYLQRIIKAVRYRVEIGTRRALLTQTYRYSSDTVPCSRFLKLEKPPLQSVTWVKYYDEAGQLQEFSASKYRVDTDSTPGRLILKDGYSWPTIWKDGNGFQVQYVCGYGTSGSSVPEDLRLLMHQMVCHCYENRVPVEEIDEITLPLIFPHIAW